MSRCRPEDWRPAGVGELEERAWEALRATDESVCVTAGAGAGKTEFLAQKAAYLLQTGLCPPPRRILAISFKRDAARTLGDRVARRCPQHQARRFTSSTFDAFTKSIVDQFGPALPASFRPGPTYAIGFPSDDEVRDFLNRHDINGLNVKQLHDLVATTRLGMEAGLAPERRAAIAAWWGEQLAPGRPATLTFPMINRLAELVVRTNDAVRRALRAAYPVVFLDEFQDTTVAQLQFLLTAFDRAATRFTAVGDDKQRIMGWAGALDNAFDLFTRACDARRIALLFNWRSNPALVEVQHVIARRLDPAVEPLVARRGCEVDGAVAAIWEFATPDAEAAGLAAWIAGEVGAGLAAERTAILVRSRADQVEEELAPALAARGLVLRNAARRVGGVEIQETLAEELTALLLPLLRLGASERDAAAWGDARDRLRGLRGLGADDEARLQLVSESLSALVRGLRRRMREGAPDPDRVAALVAWILAEVGEAEIRQAVPGYGRVADFERVRGGLIALLRECAADAPGWQDLLDRFVGRGQVPLMTVHRSKGMEFHTMVFFGLDNQSWWSLAPGRGEELNSFFVAFTRAEQRAFFTSCRARGGRIRWIDDLLGGAVPRIAGPAA